MTRFLIALAICMLATHDDANAAIVFTTGTGDGIGTPILVSPGQTGIIVPVLIESTGSDLVDGFNLGFDFSINVGGPDGSVLPSAFSNIQIDSSSSFYSGTYSAANVSAFSNVNYRFNATFDARETVTTARKAFDITFDIDGGATVGDIFQINFVPNTTPASVSTIAGPGAAFHTTQNNGSIQINGASGVPEPSSMLALAGVFAVGGVRQWRRKKRGTPELPAA